MDTPNDIRLDRSNFGLNSNLGKPSRFSPTERGVSTLSKKADSISEINNLKLQLKGMRETLDSTVYQKNQEIGILLSIISSRYTDDYPHKILQSPKTKQIPEKIKLSRLSQIQEDPENQMNFANIKIPRRGLNYSSPSDRRMTSNKIFQALSSLENVATPQQRQIDDKSGLPFQNSENVFRIRIQHTQDSSDDRSR